jgi:hypothetical protein
MYLEIISAREYYGKHATGSVLLNNGSVVLHMSRQECEDSARLITKRRIEALTEKNNHTEAAILATRLLGSQGEVDILIEIKAKQEAFGHIKYEDLQVRDRIAAPYLKILGK